MALTPFLQYQQHRFYFAAPETCLRHVQRGSFEEFDYVFVINDWYIPNHPGGLDAYRRLCDLRFERLRIMCNSKREQSFLIDEIGFQPHTTIYCPRHFCHGLIPSTDVFTLRNGTRPRFNAVLNARSESYKNRWAAANVDKLACIDFLALPPDLNCTYHNTRYLSAKEVVAILHQSQVGLMLSFIEGASLASLEYLLCGLPVVSTASLGGRDCWYDEHNCVIIGPEIEAALAGEIDKQVLRRDVRDAVDLWIERSHRGLVDSRAIRAAALQINQQFSRTFMTAISDIVKTENRHADIQCGEPLLRSLRPYYTYGAYHG